MAAKLILLAIGLAFAAHFGWVLYKVWRVRREAGEVWLHHHESGAREIEGIDEAGFRRAWFRAYGPLGSIHVYVGVAAAVLVSGPALIIFDALWRLGWRLAGAPRAYAAGFLVWQFFLYFSLIASWVIVMSLVMRRYHRHRPRDFRYELARERERAAAASRKEE